jgi:hypothetical protein
MTTTEEDHTYLILFGAPTGPTRQVIHIAHERDGEQVPRCNSHYIAAQDRQPRRFRQAEGDELTYRVCQRCQNWRGWEW